MGNITGVEIGIAIGISVFSIIVSIALIRMVANLLVVLAFAVAVFAPIIWFIVQNEAGQPVPVSMLYIGTALFAFVVTLITLPLWPIASIMQWTGKRERQRLDDIERQTYKKGQKKDPSLDIPDNRAD